MSGTCSAEIAVYAAADALPPDAQVLLGDTSLGDTQLEDARSPFAGRAWWRVVLAHAMPAGDAAAFVVVRLHGKTVAVVPMLRSGSSLTTPYTCDYTPLLAAGLDQPERIAALAAFARFCRSRGVTRLDAIPAEWAALPDLLAGIRSTGLRALRFDHFGNWHEDVGGLDWSGYLLRRPGALRETIRRRLRKAEQLPHARFELLTRPEQTDRAATAFEAVYRQSWKEPEPYPTFNVALLRAMADQGSLRFGLWSIGEAAVAVQLWIVHAGQAIVLKLAHDEAYKAHSPGTVLTALMLRHLLDHEHVTRIDYGRGDDGYKQGWATQRRQRIGLLLVNPWRLSGAVALLRHTGGQIRCHGRKARDRAMRLIVARRPAPLPDR
jgi:CelD/BcsL family acetyltransferase involved in cellulose biosynthesis